jgi:hypothetical protein
MAGRQFEDLVTTGFGLSLVRPDEPPRHGSIGWIRQWIESVNDTLKGQLGLGPPRRAAPPQASTPASPSGCWPSPPPSSTTGPPPNPSSDRLIADDR